MGILSRRSDGRTPDSWALVWLSLVLALLVVLLTSCATIPHTLCPDGQPLRILQHPACHRGICGYTCQPDRWRDIPTRLASR